MYCQEMARQKKIFPINCAEDPLKTKADPHKRKQIQLHKSNIKSMYTHRMRHNTVHQGLCGSKWNPATIADSKGNSGLLKHKQQQSGWMGRKAEIIGTLETTKKYSNRIMTL